MRVKTRNRRHWGGWGDRVEVKKGDEKIQGMEKINIPTLSARCNGRQREGKRGGKGLKGKRRWESFNLGLGDRFGEIRKRRGGKNGRRKFVTPS